MIIVTGGAGFIGSHLVRRLVSANEKVIVIDNLFSGSETNLIGIQDKISFHKAGSGQIKDLVKEKPEIIFHQGVYSSSPMYKDNPILTSKAIEDFINILEFSRKNECKIVYASSSSLYNGISPPHREDSEILITDYYTEARFAMERLAWLYNKLYGNSVIGLRYFSVYGENEASKKQYANLISQFLWNAMKNEQPVIFGDGEQTRDFTYVEDIVDANLLAAKSGLKNGVYNAGTGVETSINDMIGIISSVLGKPIVPKYQTNPIKNYVKRTLADTTKSSQTLGFHAKVNLRDGIKKLADYYKNIYR